MTQHTAILFANEAFYQAFANRDVAAMNDIWAREHPVSCIHPGWHPLFGRDEVLETWTAILKNPEQPIVECLRVGVRVFGDTALVVGFERVAGQILSVTNVLVQEDGCWRMVHHQAGPLAIDMDDEEAEGIEDDDLGFEPPSGVSGRMN